MKQLTLCLLIGLMLTSPVAAEPWSFKLGPPLPGDFFSVGPQLPGLGIPTGQYGGGRIVLIDPATAGWRTFGNLPVGSGHESISVLQSIDSGAGMNAWTESGAGAQCWTAWRGQGWKWRLTQSFAPWPWTLAGPSAASLGWVALSEGRPRRDSGSWLAKWDAWGGDRWEPITPVIPGLVIWDAAPWQGGIVLGCSIGGGQYLTEWAGRLVLVNGQSWRLVQIPAMAGVLRTYRLDSWPGRLWISTVWGEIWWTDDLERFTLWHREDYGHNAFLHEIGSRLVVASSGGKVWEYSHPEATPALSVYIPNTVFMSLSPARLSDDSWCLAGPLTMRGSDSSRPVVISPR